MRWLPCILVFGVALLLGWSVRAQPKDKGPTADNKSAPKPDPKKVQELMSQKTEHSKKVLDALMKNDLAAAGKHAEELLRIRKDAAWYLVKTDVYHLWSDQFSASAEKIVGAAKERNYEVAKLGYLEMTLVCFNCHAYLRDPGRRGRGDD
jgi:hypothetical protein